MEIYTLGADVLLQKAAPIQDFDVSLQEYIENMFTLMYDGKGIGLAAPQVGRSERFFICHIAGDDPRVFINPEIVNASPDEVAYEEGCLSIPGVYTNITRPDKVNIRAFDEKGKEFTIDAEGLLARVIQHEKDHLDGVLFIDHLGERRRSRVLKLYNQKGSA
jgi:peptide deformylase